MTDNKGNFMKALKEIINGNEGEAVKPAQQQKKAEEKLTEEPIAEKDVKPTQQQKTVDEQLTEEPVAEKGAKPAVETAVAIPVSDSTDAPALVVSVAPRMSNALPIVSAPVYSEPTVISAGTQIIGQIMAKGDVEILGEIQGDVEVAGSVRVSGKVYGNIKGHCVEMISCRVKGNVNAADDVIISADSIMVGDIYGKNVAVDGKVKGNVFANGDASFNKEALVVGNVESYTIAIEQGASVTGILKSRREKAGFRAFDEL